MDALQTLQDFQRDSRPNTSSPNFDSDIATALQKVGKNLSSEELDDIMRLVVRDRLLAIPKIFRSKDLPAAHEPLLRRLDERGYLPWTIHFLREALRRDRIVEASSIYNDIARYSSIPGARKRLPDIVGRHSVDAVLLEAIQVSVGRQDRSPTISDGAPHRPIMCAWLARDGSSASLASLRDYGGVLSHSKVFGAHVAQIVQEYAASDETLAVARELAVVQKN